MSSTNNSHISLIFRAPANRGFIQGFAGIPEDLLRRPASTASGTVEIRTTKPIKASWLKISLNKVEKLPQQVTGSASGASYPSIVNGPFTLWEAGGDWAPLETRDIDFEIPIPFDAPPTTELHYDAHGAGIRYFLEVQLCEKGKKKGLLRKETIPLSKWNEPVEISTHDLHASWPIHQQSEILYLMTPSLQIHLTIPAASYGATDIIQLPITLLLAPTSDRHQIAISLIQLSLLEISLFRSAEVESTYPKESFRLVGQRPALISQSRLEVRGDVLRPGQGGGRSWGLMLRIPHGGPGGVGSTVKGGKHLEVRYEMKVEIFGGPTGDELLGVVEKLPIILDWLSKLESQEQVSQIGFVPSLCPGSNPPLVAPPVTKSLSSPSPPYPSPPVSTHTNSYNSPASSPPVASFALAPSPPHSPVPFNAARQHQPIGIDRKLVSGTLPSSPSSSEAATGDVGTDQDVSSTRRAIRPGSGDDATRSGGTHRPSMSASSSSSSVLSQGQQNRLSFLVHNPSIRSTMDGPLAQSGDFANPPLDLTAPRASTYSPTPSFALKPIQETASPTSSNIGLGRPGASFSNFTPQQYPSAEQEKAQLFARAQATVNRTQEEALSTRTTPPENSRPSSSASSAAAPSLAQKWETAEEEKRRLFEMANYKVAVTQALAAGLATPPLPSVLLVKSSLTCPPSALPTLNHSAQPTRSTSFSPAAPSASPPQQYESAEQEKARLFQEAQSRVSRVQARSASASASSTPQAGGSAGMWGGGSSSLANGAQDASSSATRGGARVYESAEAEKARLGAQMEKQTYEEAVARVSRTQATAVAGGSSANGFGIPNSTEEERAREELQREHRLYDEAVARAPQGMQGTYRVTTQQTRAVSSPAHRTSLSLHTPPPSASTSLAALGSPSRLLSASPISNLYSSAVTTASSQNSPNGHSSPSFSSFPHIPGSPATAYPSAEQEKSNLRYQQALAARDRVASGGSLSGAAIAPQSTVSTIRGDPVPYEELFGPGPALSLAVGGGSMSSSPSSILPSTATVSTSRPRPSLPPGAASIQDEKEQMKRFYAAQEAVARATGSSLPYTIPVALSSSSSPRYPSSSSPQTQQPAPSQNPSASVSSLSAATPTYAAPLLPSPSPKLLTAQEENALFRQCDLETAQREASVSPPLARDPTISQGKQRAPTSRPSSSAGSSSGGGSKAPPPPLPPKPPGEYATRYVSLGNANGWGAEGGKRRVLSGDGVGAGAGGASPHLNGVGWS